MYYIFQFSCLDVPAQPPRMPPAAPPNQNEELYEVVTTVGGSSKANVKFKITFTSADQAVQKKIFQAPPDISWPYLQEKLQSMFSLQRSKICVFFNSHSQMSPESSPKKTGFSLLKNASTFFFTFILCNFSVQTLQHFQKIYIFFVHENKETSLKSCS